MRFKIIFGFIVNIHFRCSQKVEIKPVQIDILNVSLDHYGLKSRPVVYAYIIADTENNEVVCEIDGEHPIIVSQKGENSLVYIEKTGAYYFYTLNNMVSNEDKSEQIVKLCCWDQLHQARQNDRVCKNEKYIVPKIL